MDLSLERTRINIENECKKLVIDIIEGIEGEI